MGIEKFVKTFTPVAEDIDRLQAAGVLFGVWSGAHAVYLANHRWSNDIDVIVPDEHLGELRAALPRAEEQDLHDRYMLRSTEGLLEAMGRMTIHTADGAYDLRLNPNAADRITVHTIQGQKVPFVAPEDTLLLKAILGRGFVQGKHDYRDISAIIRNVTIDWNYFRTRVEQSQAEQRVFRVPLLREICW